MSQIEGAGAIHPETLRRLVCDGRLELAVDGRNGTPLGVRSKTRSVPPWLLLRLRRRDGGCRFLGCGRTPWLQAHHHKHGVDGGPTDAANLAGRFALRYRLERHGAGFAGSPLCRQALASL
ncbi:MAG: hypothetical protein ACRD0C_15715, partial [Acidimicrobiia bacterium]